MGEVFERYPLARWVVGSVSVTFPIIELTEQGGNRIVLQERPFRDGAKLDDTGSKPRQWSLQALFTNRLEEPGITTALYPTALRALIRSFDLHETGTLTLPTVGDVRARAQDYTRKESPETDDSATLDCTFIEDNEDALDRAQLQPPSVAATLVRLAEQTQFTAQSQGVWNEDLASLREVCSEIEGLMRAPGRSVTDLGARVRAHRRALQSVIDTAASEASTSGGLFSDPRGSELERQLRIIMDREAQAEDERVQSRPRTRGYTIDVERTSIFEVAARLNQDAEELLELNSARVDDPFLLTRGQVIRVFESPPR